MNNSDAVDAFIKSDDFGRTWYGSGNTKIRRFNPDYKTVESVINKIATKKVYSINSIPELKIGDIVKINKDRYVVKLIDKSGGAILESLVMTSKDTAIHDISIKPKNYRSAYNSKHGRSW